MNLLLLAIVSHLISDFLLQSNKIVKMKVNKYKKGYFIHGLIVFTFTFIILLIYDLNIAFKFALIISFLHIILDFIKGKISSKSPKVELYSFVIDQLIHLILIFLVWRYFMVNLTIPVSTNSNVISWGFTNFNTTVNEVLIFIMVYILVLFVGAVLLEKILNIFDMKINNQSEGLSMGRYIGIIERALILTLVTFGSISSIGIIFTAKSIARFKKFENKKHFVEYYLLGTFTSIFIALVGGLVLKSVIN